MFKVRRKQQDAIAMKGFIDRTEEHIAQDLLQRRVSAEERARLPLRAMIEHGVEVAQGYGLETERDLMLFVLNMIDINPEFHLQPHIRAILEDRSLGNEERREKLLTDVTDDEWEQAARMTEPDSYWSRVLAPDLQP
jgi:hypothetical protein